MNLTWNGNADINLIKTILRKVDWAKKLILFTHFDYTKNDHLSEYNIPDKWMNSRKSTTN